MILPHDAYRRRIKFSEKTTSKSSARQFSPSAARNCGPIREVLTRVPPRKGIVLEIGSVTGEHAICFAKALPELVWLPSDPIEAWIATEELEHVNCGRWEPAHCTS
jgi:hypothetical protein